MVELAEFLKTKGCLHQPEPGKPFSQKGKKMRSLVSAVSMMLIMPFSVNAHQSDVKKATCRKNEEGVFNFHVGED